MNNYLITGSRGSGKSTLIKRLIENNNINPVGYLTLEIKNNEGERQGFYYKSLSPLVVHENNQLIFDMKTPRPEVFRTLGVECLRSTLDSKEDYVVLDEVGRFERNEVEYIEVLNKILDSNKTVFASLKKEDIEFINEMKKRLDVKVYDLDLEDRNMVYEIINKEIKDSGGINEKKQ